MGDLINISSLELQLRSVFTKWVVQQVQSTSEHVASLERQYVAVCLERDQCQARAGRLQHSLDTERAACSEHLLTIGNMRLSARNAGCVEVEVCKGCGASAPCPHHSHLGTEKRFVNRATEDHCRRRDDRELENFHLRERLKAWEEASGKVEEVVMEETWARVKARDWKADPATGGSGELSNRQASAQFLPNALHTCRSGHPEIRYASDIPGCPLCHLIQIQVAGELGVRTDWEKWETAPATGVDGELGNRQSTSRYVGGTHADH